ncbi:MAG: response regulator [Bdellovibrionota bacterium]
MKILLAEDDANISTIAKLALEQVGGHEVHVAADGEVALRRITSEKFDLILLDEMMPKMNGLTVCEEYSKWQYREAPVIFMSANVQKERHLNGAAIGFIPKPFDPIELPVQILNIYNESKNKKSA